jgi:hypothetical protein
VFAVIAAGATPLLNQTYVGKFEQANKRTRNFSFSSGCTKG